MPEAHPACCPGAVHRAPPPAVSHITRQGVTPSAAVWVASRLAAWPVVWGGGLVCAGQRAARRSLGCRPSATLTTPPQLHGGGVSVAPGRQQESARGRRPGLTGRVGARI